MTVLSRLKNPLCLLLCLELAASACPSRRYMEVPKEVRPDFQYAVNNFFTQQLTGQERPRVRRRRCNLDPGLKAPPPVSKFDCGKDSTTTVLSR